MEQGLPQRLKQETRELHLQAERSGAMAALLRGHLSQRAYCGMLRNLHAIYAALEAALDQPAADARLAPLWQAALRREAALASDLDALHGSGWPGAYGLEPAAVAYVERLRGLQAAASIGLAAHVYTRCLGDLHGGQILGRIVREQFGLTGEDGTRFYDFGTADRVLQLRAELRNALGGISVHAAEADLIVAEARWSFVAHRQLFEELQARYG